jgi:outer membrane receptor for ferrienterochelin and colicins
VILCFFKIYLLRMVFILYFSASLIMAAPKAPSPPVPPVSAENVQPAEAEEGASIERRLRHKKVIISAARTETQLADSVVQVEVISKEDIRNRGARTVSDVLNNQTGFFIQRSGVSGDNVQVQGLNSTYLLILRDGERINGRLNGGNYDLSRLRVENIERIEIVRGSASAVYGADAIAGVINIVTRQPDKPRAETRIQGGNMGAFDAAAAFSFPLGKWGFKGAGGYRTQQPFRYDKTSVKTDGRGIVDYSGEGGVEYNFAPNWVAAVQGDYQQRRLWGTDALVSGGIFDRTNLTETGQAAFRIHTRRNVDTYDQNLTERDDTKLRKELNQDYGKADFRLNGSYTSFKDQYLYDQRGDSALDKYEPTRENTYVIHGQAAIPVGIGRLTTGAEGFFENLTTVRIIPDFVKRNRASGYTQLETRFFDSLVITPGIRYDHDSQFGDYVSPRIGAKWGNEDFIVRASAGMGYRAPSFRELYLYFENPSVGYTAVGNPNLKAESTKSVNLGAEAYVTKKLSIDVNAYFNDISNFIATKTLSLNPLAFQYDNIARAYTTGIDHRITYYLFKYLRASVGYSLTFAENVERGLPLQGVARHRGNFGLLFRYKGLMLRGLLSVIDQMPYYGNADLATQVDYYTKPYWTADVNAEYMIAGGFSVYAGGENLNSAGDVTYLPMAPIRVYGGARYIFGD